MPKLIPLPKLKKKADAVFSKWIRERDRSCYTCMRVIPPEQLQNGHYISRTHLSLRYDERNCHAQCVSCNVFKHGNMTVYALRLINDYGTDLLREFERVKHEKVDTRTLLNEVIQKYGTRKGD